MERNETAGVKSGCDMQGLQKHAKDMLMILGTH